MPVFRSEKLRNGVQWVLWHMEESIEALEKEVILTASGREEWQNIRHPKKKQEWLAGRMALQHLCQTLSLPYQGIEKDKFGKPHLKDCPGHISLSHCFPFAAAAYFPDEAVGIDLEMVQDKIQRLAPKFLDKGELAFSQKDTDALVLRWSAKEALYKLYGRKQLAFKEQIKTGAFGSANWGFFGASVLENEEHEIPCQVYFEKVAPQHWVTVALKRHPEVED